MKEIALPFFPQDMFASDHEAVLAIVRDVALDPSQRFILGGRTAQLEDRAREATGARNAVACSSGTGGLALAVQALGIGPGDEVIVPAFCCQPVASTVVNAGAAPVFVDVDAATLVMDPGEVERAITPNTKAIMAAHVFSVMADMPALEELAGRHDIGLIEDAAVAQGGVLDGRPAGLWGDIGVWSFFQVKALGAIGEGGMVLTDDDELAATCRMLRNHGQGAERGIHLMLGQNNRMDELIAAFLLHRYEGLTTRLERRAEIAAYYTQRFAHLRELGLITPPAGHDGRCYYVYAVLTDERDALRAHLAEMGIGTHVYYPLPLPAQPAFRAFSCGRRFARAEAAGRRNLALPIYPHLTDGAVERITDHVTGFYESRRTRAA